MLDYKIKHKNYVSNSEEIGSLSICDDLYLVDCRNKLTVIGSRDISHRLVRGSNVAEILDADGRRALRGYLFGYNEKPIFLRTELGGAFAFGGIFPSTSTFLLSFINSDKNGDLERILSSGKIADVLFPYSNILFGKIYKRDAELLNNVEYVLKNTNKAIKNILINEYIGEEKTIELLNNIVLSAARLVGCEVRLSYAGSVVCDNRFDQSAFKAFLISLLMLCRNRSKSRVAKVELSSCFEGLTVDVSFDLLDELSCATAPEITTFRYFAEMNRMIFEHFSDRNSVMVRFCPSRKDWSYIELKSEAEFDWNS